MEKFLGSSKLKRIFLHVLHKTGKYLPGNFPVMRSSFKALRVWLSIGFSC